MRDGLYEMLRDAVVGNVEAEMRVEVAHAMLIEAVEILFSEPNSHALTNQMRKREQNERHFDARFDARFDAHFARTDL